MSQPYGNPRPRADRVATRVVEVVWLLPEVAALAFATVSLVHARQDEGNTLYELGVLIGGCLVAWFAVALVSTVVGLYLRRTWLLVVGKVLTLTGFLGGPFLLLIAVLIVL